MRSYKSNIAQDSCHCLLMYYKTVLVTAMNFKDFLLPKKLDNWILAYLKSHSLKSIKYTNIF